MKKCRNLVKKVMSFMLLSALVIAMIQPVTSYSQEEDGSGTGNILQGEAGNGTGNNPQEDAGNGTGDTQQGEAGSGAGNNPQGEAGSGTGSHQQSDITAPAIEDFRLLQQGQTLKKGDTATLEIYAYDQESGIDEINVSVSYEGGYYIDGDVSYNEEKECYEWKHKLENISGSKLVIYSVTVTDKVGHSTSKSSFENGAYTVWADVEWQKPETTEVHITDFQLKQNGQRVNEADQLEMSLETDKISGLGVVFVIFRNLRGDEITICLRADESGRVFRNSEYSMGAYAEDGKWMLSSIYLMRLPENPVKLYTDQICMEDYSFTLKKTPGTGETEEAGEAPEITQVELEKNGEVLNAGDQASITIYVSDKQEMEMSESGCVSFRAVSDIREQWKTVNLIYNKDRGAYEGTLTIADDMYPCEWYVETVCLLSNTQRPKKESYITLDVEMEDYYRIKNEGKNSTT